MEPFGTIASNHSKPYSNCLGRGLEIQRLPYQVPKIYIRGTVTFSAVISAMGTLGMSLTVLFCMEKAVSNECPNQSLHKQRKMCVSIVCIYIYMYLYLDLFLYLYCLYLCLYLYLYTPIYIYIHTHTRTHLHMKMEGVEGCKNAAEEREAVEIGTGSLVVKESEAVGLGF